MLIKKLSVNNLNSRNLNTLTRTLPLNYLMSFLILTSCLFFLLFTPKQAHAACTYTGTSSSTYTYTAANYGNKATLTLNGTWRCEENGNYGTSRYTCLKPVFSSPLTGPNSNYTLPYTVTATAGTTTTGSNATTGKWYGPGATTVNNNYMTITLTIDVPAPSTILPAGTYSSSVKLYVDMQAAQGTLCEGGTGENNGWDSGSINFAFNYVVPPICYLTSVTDIDFGNIADAGLTKRNYDADGAVVTRCNVNRSYSIYLGNGNNRITGGNRRMANGSNYLAYQLYKEAARINIWDSTGGVIVTGGSGGVAVTGTGVNQNFPVYGRIPKGTSIPPAGSYTDTVVVTVTY
ncbi:Csu type fimbrial protein [Acinetobacter sp. GXMZU3951]